MDCLKSSNLTTKPILLDREVKQPFTRKNPFVACIKSASIHATTKGLINTCSAETYNFVTSRSATVVLSIVVVLTANVLT